MLPTNWPSDMDYDTAMGRPEECPDTLCHVCGKREAVIEDEWSGERRCADCEDTHHEARWVAQQEREFAAYHGGNTPFNDAERLAVQGRKAEGR